MHRARFGTDASPPVRCASSRAWRQAIPPSGVYQEIIHEIRPDLIVETGTHQGGSASAGARPSSIDVAARTTLPPHPRITYLVGSSTSEDVLADVARRAEGSGTVLVTLDSGHTKQHVAREIDVYRRFVTTGSYLITRVLTARALHRAIPKTLSPGGGEGRVRGRP